jgi:hypothetical protein
VYGAIAFYLSRQSEIDEYLSKYEEEYELARHANHEQLAKRNPNSGNGSRARRKNGAPAVDEGPLH